jgi:hypothetical protein
MAKLIVDLPREWEARVTLSADGKQIEIEPSFMGGAAYAPCLFLTSQGEGGMQRRTVIMLNGNSGWPESRRVKEGPRQCAFDMPIEEYKKKHAGEEDEADDDE